MSWQYNQFIDKEFEFESKVAAQGNALNNLERRNTDLKCSKLYYKDNIKTEKAMNYY